MYKFRKNCRLCSSKDFKLVLDLGLQPPSNSFLTKDQIKKSERKFPLRLYLCKKCFHLQLLDVVDKQYLFSNYLYMTSANKPIIDHFETYANEIHKKFLKGKKNGKVVEIGSNDGTLLKKFQKYDVDVLGIEPAKNLAKISNRSKIKTKNNFFDYKLAKKLRRSVKADVIIANNVLGHVDNLNEFIKGISELINDDGVFVFEVPHALELIKKLEFDTIYHEHISYFMILPLDKWLNKNNFEIFDIEKQKVHGGTLRVFVSKKGNYKIKNSVERIKKQEISFGVNKIKTFSEFSKKIINLRVSLTKKLNQLIEQDFQIFGYGAPAKGNVLLNFCDIDTKILDFVTDTTILKQNKYTPGTHIPIKSPKILSKKGKKCIGLLLAWNYKDSIIKKERKFLKRGGKLLIPIPKPVLI